jgi:hypothetical protein
LVPNSVIAAALCTAFLMSGNAARADEYRAGELLSLDLPRALLSPKRLGPETQFAPVRIEARTDSRPVTTERAVVRKAAEYRMKPRAAVRTKVTRRPSNPLDAQARDTRIQKWPCTSGGICDWQN